MLILVSCSCSYKEIEDNARNKLNAAIEAKKQSGNMEEQDEGSAVERTTEGIKFELESENVGEGGGHMNYIITDARYYPSVEAAGIEKDELASEYVYADWIESDRPFSFIVLNVIIENIDAPGSPEDGHFNVSRLYLMDSSDEDGMATSPDEEVFFGLQYQSIHGTGETDYYHVQVEMGEKIELEMGYFVPADNLEEAKKYFAAIQTTYAPLSAKLDLKEGNKTE